MNAFEKDALGTIQKFFVLPLLVSWNVPKNLSSIWKREMVVLIGSLGNNPRMFRGLTWRNYLPNGSIHNDQRNRVAL